MSEVTSNLRTVWVNSEVDGSMIGRFDKRFGMDIHRPVSEQITTGAECLHCTHGEPGAEGWAAFRDLMLHHYGVELDPGLLSFEEET